MILYCQAYLKRKLNFFLDQIMIGKKTLLKLPS